MPDNIVTQKPAEPRIALCLPRRGQVDTRHLNCLDKFLDEVRAKNPACRVGPMTVHKIDGMGIIEARTLLTKLALATKPDYLLWIDDDMIFQPQDVRRLYDALVRSNNDIVGGLCHNRRPPFQPIMGRHPHPDWHLPEQAYQWLFDYLPNSIVPVDCTGGAFLLVKAEVFWEIEKRFGDNCWWQPIHECGEDISFCWRAEQCGAGIAVDTSIDIGHIASIVVDRNFARKNTGIRWASWHNPHERAYRTNAFYRDPEVTVVIPTFNQKPEFLKAAVQSVLNQTLRCEIIVVDDGSDVSVDDIMPLGVRVIRHETNRGISAALNTGINHARGEYICWLSSDDLMDPDKVACQLATMGNREAHASFHLYNLALPDGNLTPVMAPHWNSIPEQMKILARYCAINGSTAMIHKSVFEKVGYFDETLRYGQDWEMWCRIGEHFLWHLVEDCLGTRREGWGNLTEKLTKGEDAAKTKLKLDEDALIRAKYARWLSDDAPAVSR